MSKIVHKLVVETDEQEVHSVILDSEALAALVGALPYSKCEDEFVSLLGYLAQSSSSEVRKAVAENNAINEDILELLAKDKAVDVRRSVSYCDEFKTWASTEIVIDYIQSDIECAKSIAGDLGSFTEVDTNTIADMLCNHTDPGVRKALADSYSAPKKILKQLLTDTEHSVRCAARDSLD